MTKSYWIFQWRPSPYYCEKAGIKVPAAQWIFSQEVFEESAYLAGRRAAICVQRELGNNLTEPVDPEHIKLRKVEIPYVWCMPHDQGSCIHRYPLDRRTALSWVGGKRPAPTACGYYVQDVESISLSVPSCHLCLVRLIQEHDPEVLRLTGIVDEERQHAILTLARAILLPPLRRQRRTKGRSKRPKAITKRKVKARAQRGKPH